MRKPNSIFGRFLSPLCHLYGRVLLIMTLFASLANAQPDDSLEYFLTHAQALVRDVRKNLVPKNDERFNSLVVYERKLESADKVLQSLKSSLPLCSFKVSEANIVSPDRDEYPWSQATYYGVTDSGNTKLLGVYTPSLKVNCDRNKMVCFKTPISLTEQNTRHLNDVNKSLVWSILQAHCFGLDEDYIKSILPEGTPFDVEVARSICRYRHADEALKDFLSTDPSCGDLDNAHPFHILCGLLFPHLLQVNVTEKSHDPFAQLSELVEKCSRDRNSDYRNVWDKYTQWCLFHLFDVQEKLIIEGYTTEEGDYIPPKKIEGFTEEQAALQYNYARRLIRLLRTHPIHRNFTLFSPEDFDAGPVVESEATNS